jgi:hypothetical protein
MWLFYRVTLLTGFTAHLCNFVYSSTDFDYIGAQTICYTNTAIYRPKSIKGLHRKGSCDKTLYRPTHLCLYASVRCIVCTASLRLVLRSTSRPEGTHAGTLWCRWHIWIKLESSDNNASVREIVRISTKKLPEGRYLWSGCVGGSRVTFFPV